MDAERFEDETYEAVSVTQTWQFRRAKKRRRVRLPSVSGGIEYISYTQDAPIEPSTDRWNIERELRFENDRRSEEYAE